MAKTISINGRTFTAINKNTERANHIINSYENSWATSLRHVYGSWSGAKDDAYDYCKELFADVKGEGFRITGACTNFFSVAFRATEDDKNYLVYITHAGDYAIEL